MDISDVEGLGRRLRLISSQALRLANEIACSDSGSRKMPKRHMVADDNDLWLVLAEEQYRQRSRRREVLPNEIFGEPAWDILLDLYIAEKRGEHVSITSACLAAQVPPTTALRWIGELESKGLVTRERDARDGRRTFIYLTQDAYERMTEIFIVNHGHLIDEVERQSRPFAGSDANSPQVPEGDNLLYGDRKSGSGGKAFSFG